MYIAEKAILVAAGVALMGSVAAIGTTAFQALANPSGTVVTSVPVIVASCVMGRECGFRGAVALKKY